MKLNISQLNNNHFVSVVHLDYLIYSIEKVYGKKIKEIEKEYDSKKISEDYSEYVISSLTTNNSYLDNIILFTKEDIESSKKHIELDKFIVADGFSKLFIMNNLLKTKEFILKRINLANIEAFEELYKGVFTKQTQIPMFYLKIVLMRLHSTYKNNIIKFANEFLMQKNPLTLISSVNEYTMSEYISNKNITNKLLTSDTLNKQIKFKMLPYIEH